MDALRFLLLEQFRHSPAVDRTHCFNSHVATKSDSHSLLCSFFHIPAFHSNLCQTGDLQSEGCRHLSVILTFHLLRCLTRLYVNLPITDSSGRKYADRGITLPQHLINAII